MAIQAQLYQENPGFPLFGNSSHDLINGCFNNNNHHQQQQQQQQMSFQFHESHGLNQRNDHNVWLINNMVPNSNNNVLFDHIEKNQRQEIDQYIKYQNERLRIMVQEQRKQNLVTLMRKVEPKLMSLMRHKEEEISLATKRTMELQDLLKSLEAESLTWQRIARENEAMVLSLNTSLEQARANSNYYHHLCSRNDSESNVVEDQESCCDDDSSDGGGGGDSGGDRRQEGLVRACERCGDRDSCMLLLPCRHFCSCKECEKFLDSCPVCKEPKKASIEALLTF